MIFNQNNKYFLEIFKIDNLSLKILSYGFSIFFFSIIKYYENKIPILRLFIKLERYRNK